MRLYAKSRRILVYFYLVSRLEKARDIINYMKNILAKSPLNKQLYHQLSQSKNGLVLGTTIASLNQFLNVEKRDPSIFWKLFQLLNTLPQEKIPTFKTMIPYPTFLEEILLFLEDYFAFDMKLDQLPQENPLEIELKEIISYLVKTDLMDDYQKQLAHHKALLKKGLAFELRDYVEPNPYYQALLDQLHLQTQSYSFNKDHSRLQLALNIRQELELIAQEICETSTTTSIILSDYSNQLPILKQVFSRYSIPFSAYKDQKRKPIGESLQELLLVSRKKDPNAFFHLISKKVFPNTFSQEELYVFFNYYQKLSFPFPELPLNSIQEVLGKDSREYKKYQKYNESFQSFFQQNNESLSRLFSTTSLLDQIQIAYHILITSPTVDDEICYQLQNFLNELGDQVDEDSFDFFYDLLNSFNSISIEPSLSNIMVTDLEHPLLPSEKSFIVGLNSEFFPQVPLKKGVFNEDYYSKLPYPSFEKRYQDYLRGISWIYHSGKEMIFSYSQKDYEGKSLELSFDIKKHFLINVNEEEVLQVKQCHPVELAPSPWNQHQDNLSKRVIKQLLPSPLHSSVSSIEMWYRCPYQYFLSRVLKLKDETLFEPNPLYIGTLVHHFFEMAVKEKGKNYADYQEEDIKKAIQPYFNLWMNMYPLKKESYQLIFDKLIRNLSKTISFLNQYEANYPELSPLETEQAFHFLFNQSLQLDGIIDRVDYSPSTNEYILYDYKSSSKNIQLDQYLTGQQLQLMIYKYILEQHNKNVKAGYYVSFLPETIKLDSLQFKFNRRSVQEEPMDYYDDNLLSQKQLELNSLSGWKESDDKSIYNKNSITSKNFPFSFDQLNTITSVLIDQFHKELQKGTIQREPQNCSFCLYRRICNFKGSASNQPYPSGIESLLNQEEGVQSEHE